MRRGLLRRGPLFGLRVHSSLAGATLNKWVNRPAQIVSLMQQLVQVLGGFSLEERELWWVPQQVASVLL